MCEKHLLKLLKQHLRHYGDKILNLMLIFFIILYMAKRIFFNFWEVGDFGRQVIT